jgi:hypothetical protein
MIKFRHATIDISENDILNKSNNHYIYTTPKTETDYLIHSVLAHDISYNEYIDHHIEYYFVNTTNYNKDTYHSYNYESFNHIQIEYPIPLYSGIVSLSDNNKWLITNITNDKFKFKLFSKEKELFLFVPKKGDYILFDGDCMFGRINDTKPSNALIFHVYKGKHHNRDRYTLPSTMNKIHFTEKNITDCKYNIIENSSFFTYDFFEEILYKKHISSTLLETLSSISETSSIVYKIEDITINDCSIDLSEMISYPKNRFSQRFIYKQFISSSICKYFIDMFKQYRTIEKIPGGLHMILRIFESIYIFLKKSYSIPDDITINIKKIHTDFESLEYNSLYAAISFYTTNLKFEDNTQYFLNEGDTILYYHNMNIINDNLMLYFQLEFL